MSQPQLPEGYWVERSADTTSLIAPNGKVVAWYVAGVEPEEIERTAHEHSEKVDAGIANLDRLLRNRRSRRPKQRGEGL